MSKHRKPRSSEPRTENLGTRDFTGADWAATEREQTADLRNRNPEEERDVSLGGVSSDLENKYMPRFDRG